jgi:hypothetical protein
MSAGSMSMDQIDPHGLGHPLSLLGVLMAFLTALGILPIVVGTVGGMLGICYYGVSLYETATVQAYIKRRRERKRAKLQAKLQAMQRLDS